MKKPISATIDVKLLKWIEKELKENVSFRNKSHIIEVALLSLKETLENIKSQKSKSKKESST